jgi:hypothetical protein
MEFVFAVAIGGGDFARDLILAMLPVVLDGMRSKSVVLRAFAWNFTRALGVLDPTSDIAKAVVEQMEGQSGFVELFGALNTVIHTPFGGKLPRRRGGQARLALSPQQRFEIMRTASNSSVVWAFVVNPSIL